MCWNEHVSLNTFLFSSFVLLLIIYNNYYTKYKIKELHSPWIYLFFASFIFMQLIEFFIWRNINNKLYNNIFSLLGAGLIFIQPVISIMIIQNIRLRNVLLASYISLAIMWALYEISHKNVYTEISKKGHLKWAELHNTFIWFFFFAFSIIYSKNKALWALLIFATITIIISALYYRNDKSVGSMWCWGVNSLMIYYAFYLLLYLPFLEKKNSLLPSYKY